MTTTRVPRIMRVSKKELQQRVREEISRATRGGRAAALVESPDGPVTRALATQIVHHAAHLANAVAKNAAFLERIADIDRSGVISDLLEMHGWSRLGGREQEQELARESDDALEQSPPDI